MSKGEANSFVLCLCSTSSVTEHNNHLSGTQNTLATPHASPSNLHALGVTHVTTSRTAPHLCRPLVQVEGDVLQHSLPVALTSLNGSVQLTQPTGHLRMHLALTSRVLREWVTIGIECLTYLQVQRTQCTFLTVSYDTCCHAKIAIQPYIIHRTILMCATARV